MRDIIKRMVYEIWRARQLNKEKIAEEIERNVEKYYELLSR